jgi:hypothetical protein
MAALSDDPAEMAQQLIDMAGGTAIIKVDSSLGGTLPPKALIKRFISSGIPSRPKAMPRERMG